ncbi:MAG: adenylate/guanylate cyclase domain-containing protein [Dehalococcoidia bacterium]
MNTSVATATVLFTDVVASTTMRTSNGDLPALTTLATHEAAIRKQIERHGGRKVKTIGDGFMIVFKSAKQSVECAVAIQQALHGIQESPVRVRIGIHTGDVIEVGDDVFGAAVDAATRIMSRARGGEILISEMVRGVVGSVADFQIKERRPVKLKGFPTRWRLYEVAWATTVETAPRRDLALVVTDMVGSTSSTERLGEDEGWALVRAHNAIIRAQADAHGCVSSKFLGDGFLLAFERRTDALGCASAIQQAFAAYRLESDQPMHVCIAVHAGRLIEEAGELFGLAPMIAFRLLDEAAPDEVLVTEAALPPDHECILDSPRSLALRGISGSQIAYRLDWATDRGEGNRIAGDSVVAPQA